MLYDISHLNFSTPRFKQSFVEYMEGLLAVSAYVNLKGPFDSRAKGVAKAAAKEVPRAESG
jgi:hypothetical protein